MNANSEGESFPGSVQSKCFSGHSARSGARAQARLRRSEQARGPEIGVTARACVWETAAGALCRRRGSGLGVGAPYPAQGWGCSPVLQDPLKGLVGEEILFSHYYPRWTFPGPRGGVCGGGGGAGWR